MVDRRTDMHRGKSPYWMFAANLLISGVIMYLVMFAMIDGLRDFRHNLNMLYMTLMMVAPMAILMVVMMPGMYAARRANLGIVVAFAVVFAGAFLGIRQQLAITDIQFIRSMIPHHSGAILMCRQASLRDPELKALCREIIRSQRSEIIQMNAIGERLSR